MLTAATAKHTRHVRLVVVHEYYSQRVGASRARTQEQITSAVWRGLVAVIHTRVESESFGSAFPVSCSWSAYPAGTNFQQLEAIIAAEHADVPWPVDGDAEPPPTLAVLDLLECLHDIVAEPHDEGGTCYQHSHYTWDAADGQASFRQQINRIFSRNGIAFELGDDGHISRLAPEPIRDALRQASFQTGDGRLDELLTQSRAKFLDPDPEIRRDGLEKIWDAFERVKTRFNDDKKEGIKILLDKSVANEPLRERIDAEMRLLTTLGNDFQIRHFESTKHALKPEDIDYLYQRLFSLFDYLLQAQATWTDES